jgi:hypothetical protein
MELHYCHTKQQVVVNGAISRSADSLDQPMGEHCARGQREIVERIHSLIQL